MKHTLEKNIVGRLPMGLAETKENDGTNASKCLTSVFFKVIVIIICISFFFGVYFWVLWWLTSDADNLQSGNFIVVTKFNTAANTTFVPDDFEIVLRLRNNSQSRSNFSRIKRQIDSQSVAMKRPIRQHTGDQIEKARRMISEHNILCNEESHKDRCKELMAKLNIITYNNLHNLEVSSNYNRRQKKSDKLGTNFYPNHRSDYSGSKLLESNFPTNTQNRLTKSIPNDLHTHYHIENSMNIIPTHSEQYQGPTQQLTDTCLLARLMKQSFPHLHGVYDKQESEYPHPYGRHKSHNHLYSLNHDVSKENFKEHPQDIEISRYLAQKQDIISEETSNTTIREIQCQVGEFACDNGEACIDEKNCCDGFVDCSDMSDESQCTCKDRVDPTRICDGYFDCPFGEDEMGCNECNENEFSCENAHVNQEGTCFSREQRCDSQADCSNHKDETDCIMLAPKLHMKPLFAVSNTEGYLQRNFKGHWYSVCSNPYMWAHDACRRETGLIIRPPYIKMVKIDPALKMEYINMVPGGLTAISDTCLNSSAVYVTCPDLVCGTRIQPTSQILKENIATENNIFGRNRRFLVQNPEPFLFNGKRGKRYTAKHLEENNLMNNSARIDDARDKRAETRVVGGKPSQPAAWPWMVAVYRDGMFHCGGVIINQNWIMSAAHCVHKFWQHYYEVRVGMLRRLSFSPQEQNHRVSHVIVNQYYNQENMKNDISLLHVRPGIQFSRWIRPICLPSPEVAGLDWESGPQPGTICTAVGWGATIERGPDPDHMREVEVPIWDQCNHREDLAGNEICAGFVEGGKDTCQGDSGGPLLCKNPMNAQQWYIAGIVSHGNGCGQKGEPGVYTRVSLFVSWIRLQISSKYLPSIQPKQECPGFRCDSGILKCLPKKRMCDQLIDCLDGEDETNCESKKSKMFREVNSNEFKDKEVNISEIKSLSMVKNESANENLDKTEKPIDVATEVIEFSTPRENPPINYKKINDTQNLVDLQNISHNASTVEINSESSSDSKEGSTENITSDPIEMISNEETEHFTVIETTTISMFSEKVSEHDISTVNTIKVNIQDGRSELDKSKSDEKTHTSSLLNETLKFENDTGDHLNSPSIRSNTIDSSEDIRNLCHTEETSENCNNSMHNSFNFESNSQNDEKIQRGDMTQDKLNEKLVNNDPAATKNNKSEDIPSTEIKKAKPRKKHLFPSEFECARIQQLIPYEHRCDQKADCEDGTDEFGCTCTDYLATFERNLLCDGNIDCSDGQDEIDCFECENKQFLCKRDQLCVPSKYACDGQRQCPSGDDELGCLTLSNGKEVVYDFNGKPEVSLSGYITKKQDSSWHILCEETMSIDLQEEAANYVCRYMGFSSANRYLLKHINIEDSDLLNMEDRRMKRNVINSMPVHFTFKNNKEGDMARNVIIKDPEIIKENCVPNITKTCMTLYVFCDPSLFTDLEVPEVLTLGKTAEDPKEITWPWIAKLYVDGSYKCTGVLIDLSWVLVSHSCLRKTILTHHYITIILGAHRTLENIKGPYEQIHKVDVMKEFYRSKVTLLHLKAPAKYSAMVKPMGVSSHHNEDMNATCVVVGQNKFNTSFTIFLKEDQRDCEINNRCFTYESNVNLCEQESSEDFGAIISCHSQDGWYPAASYVKKDTCHTKRITAFEIEHLKYEIRHSKDMLLSNSQELDYSENCLGVRCQRGRCVDLRNVCNGIPNCEDAGDESKSACKLKIDICTHDPFYKGCDCPSGELKCRNGRCIAKELFKNGHNDCGDSTDEPGSFRCSDYLSRVMPSRLCDGILHCHDRSDEDPTFCKCFAKQGFDCRGGQNNDDYCVAMDMVCDGVRDCPNGEDERQCFALHAPEGTRNGVGEVVVRSHGVWFSKCYPSQNHTKSALEKICRQLGFISGHSKQLTALENMRPHPHNNIVLDNFSNVTFNNKTSIKLRNTHLPMAKAIAESKENCYPLFIECL